MITINTKNSVKNYGNFNWNRLGRLTKKAAPIRRDPVPDMPCMVEFCNRTSAKLYKHSAWSESRNTRRSNGVRTGSSVARTNLASPTDAQPPRATGRPFGTKYDNIDQNKAKKEGPGGARGQTGSRNILAGNSKISDGPFWILFSIEYLISDGPFRKTPTLTSYSSAQQQTLIYALVLASLRPN